MGSSAKNEESTLKKIWHVIIILVVFILITINYTNKMHKKAENVVINRYMQIAQDASRQYAEKFSAINTTAKMIAGYCSNSEDHQNSTNTSLLATAKDKLNLDNGYIIDQTKSVIDSENNVYPSAKDIIPFVEFSEDKIDKVNTVTSDGKLIHYILQPIGNLNEGAVVLVFSNEKLSSISDVAEGAVYARNIAYFLLSKDGTILDNAGYGTNIYKVGSNVFEALDIDNLEFVNITRNTFLNNIETGVSGNAEVKKDGGSSYIVYTPVSEDDCLIMLMITEKQMKARVKEENRYTAIYLWELIALFIILIGYSIVILIQGVLKLKNKSRTLTNRAETDLLSGLYNKITTENKIKEYISESEDNKAMMFLIDIDNFKKINDTMGHAFGDEVIKSVGQALKAQFRASDIVGRLGGDEFVVFLKNMPDNETMMKESKKLDLLFKDFQVGTYTRYKPTASIGVTVFPKDGQDFETLYKRADEALYRSKNNGKNQLTYYNSPDSDKKEGEE
ncbi:MAG: GGDEF domain-containing protein [Lachnospiraceae bacterium]|nr:GGDEF domain-containing protein [Lachnospiraceae bacterium]